MNKTAASATRLRSLQSKIARDDDLPGDLVSRLRLEIEGEVLCDAFSRGRYSTDASIYQIVPLGVVVPRNEQDIVRAVQIAGDAGVREMRT